jgi:hypothetical protein
VVGDAPEGLAMSPAGGYAASLLLNGSGGTPKTAFYWHEHSLVVIRRGRLALTHFRCRYARFGRH